MKAPGGCIVLALIGCLGLASCGIRPTEKTQVRIVTMLQRDLGAVSYFEFLPTINRCQVDFECRVISYDDGVPVLYRGYYGYGHVYYQRVDGAEEGGATP
jgi:hypothetical protein